MSITVRFFLTLKEVVNNQDIQISQDASITIREVLDRLVVTYGNEIKEIIFDTKTKKVNSFIKVIVNGRHYSTLPDRLDTVLKDGDEIAIFPPIAGG